MGRPALIDEISMLASTRPARALMPSSLGQRGTGMEIVRVRWLT
jgi:hypothetical protein